MIETCRGYQGSFVLSWTSSLKNKKMKKSLQLFVTQHMVRGTLFFRRPPVFYTGRSSLWAPPVFHQGALRCGVSPQLMRSPMQQDVIAGSQCGRNSLPGICTQARLRRVRWEPLTGSRSDWRSRAALQLKLHHRDQHSAENPKTSDMLGDNIHI